jgi:outer membrane protein assembly factor BamB
MATRIWVAGIAVLTALLLSTVARRTFVPSGGSDKQEKLPVRHSVAAARPIPDSQSVSADEERDGGAARSEPGLVLHTDPSLDRKFKAVKDYIKQESWADATRILQALLDGSDAFLPAPAGADAQAAVPRLTTLHAEANSLLNSLPSAGREFYDFSVGGHARTLLARAQKENDPHLLAEVSRRYLHTAAGAEATRLLAIHHLDRDRCAMASLCFERLLDGAGADRLSPTVLCAAALAFQRGGDGARATQAWTHLAARAPAGLHLGAKTVKLPDLQVWLGKHRPPARASSTATDWPLFHGDAARCAWPAGGDTEPKARWQQATAHETATRMWLEKAVQQQQARGPALPAFFPITVGGKILYRSYWGIQALDAKTGNLLWESESTGAIDTLGVELRYFPYLESWINAYLQHDPHILFGNSVVGTLSADEERVYAIDDLAVPPFQNTYHARGRPVSVAEHTFPPRLHEAARHSQLVAVNLKSGKLVWERGGNGSRSQRDELYPCYFLGPPLPIAGRLYLLIEKEQELRFACLDAAHGNLLWDLPLGLVPRRLLVDPARRVHAVHPAYSEGILLCPSNAGYLVAIDPVGRSFLWAYAYDHEIWSPDTDLPLWRPGGRGRGMPSPAPPPDLRPAWLAPAPIIYDGRVILTAPDSRAIHCLRLRDGALLWKTKRAEFDLYVGGVARDKVLVVGSRSCRALDLADGKPLWDVATGVPSGVGVAGDAVFYLPLKAAARDKLPAICAIAVSSGIIQAQGTLAENETPGNLLFCGDCMLSQTVTGISAYALRPRPDGQGP